MKEEASSILSQQAERVNGDLCLHKRARTRHCHAQENGFEFSRRVQVLEGTPAVGSRGG
jgi:hypothetical protein